MARSKRQKKWALIWWLNTRERDVIPLNKIPKADQKVNAITKLKWKAGAKAEYIEVKVLQISSKYKFYSVFNTSCLSKPIFLVLDTHFLFCQFH